MLFENEKQYTYRIIQKVIGTQIPLPKPKDNQFSFLPQKQTENQKKGMYQQAHTLSHILLQGHTYLTLSNSCKEFCGCQGFSAANNVPNRYIWTSVQPSPRSRALFILTDIAKLPYKTLLSVIHTSHTIAWFPTFLSVYPLDTRPGWSETQRRKQTFRQKSQWDLDHLPLEKRPEISFMN